ncbi:transposase family protein [Rhodococcus sp. NPDC003318]|uniref:transposase family protein n=1 Tax=Rhodococcus sp. NPDC003318 TaxID=3364503 RepID=UPI003685A83E
MRPVGEVIRIGARPRSVWGRCPKCLHDSERVHSRYRRRPADTAIGGYPVVIDLRVRRSSATTTTVMQRHLLSRSRA